VEYLQVKPVESPNIVVGVTSPVRKVIGMSMASVMTQLIAPSKRDNGSRLMA